MARTDIEDAFGGQLKNLLTTASKKAVDAAIRSAADVYVRAAKQAAPKGQTGQLAQSIKLIKGKSKNLVVSAQTVMELDSRYFVGPERKKTVDYGYFVEHGHRSYVRHIRGKGFRSKRLMRDASIPAGATLRKTRHGYRGPGTHSQRGYEHLEPGKGRVKVIKRSGRVIYKEEAKEPNIIVPARPWFEPAVTSVEKQAQQAAEDAFYRTLKQEDK